MIRLIAIASVALGCHSGLDRVRYKNAPIVTAVNDRVHLPKPPPETFISNRLYHFDALFHRPLVDATKPGTRRRALDINALGEVPDSSWFTNRIGVREVSIEELRRGPNVGPGPMAHKPWSVVRSKAVGKAPGFIIEDAAGDRYLLKFDHPEAPEAESGAHIVVHRLLWALGYFVPEDHIVTFEPKDLVMADDAVIADRLGRKTPMPPGHIDSVLARAHRLPDGSYRALVSKFVPGKPLGGFSDEGVRPGDPNDTIGHQHRRSLRGMFPIVAWLKHTDLKPENTLDAWVTDESDPDRRYVRHYLIDFGKALGVLGRQGWLRSDGYARWLDFADIARSAMTAGLYPRAWDGVDSPRYRGLGIYQVGRYDPGDYESRTAWKPFVEATDSDMLWGAKLMMRLTPEHIRAAVDEGRFSDPRARDYLARTLIARQRKTARYWFSRANPLDDFTATGDLDVCFDDLVRRHRLAGDEILAATRFAVEVYDHGGERLEYPGRMTLDTRTGRLCVRDLPTGGRPDRYTIISIDTLRPGIDTPPVMVHVALDPRRRTPRVIGVRRLD